ncbi:MAG: hypothetical protein FJX18_07545 [Alphaproteobacteria bacterium]|nr:hypothetical protein [Alphaproteobacteria bacterium]
MTVVVLSQVVLTQRINPTDLLIAASTAGALHKLTSSIPYLEKASNAIAGSLIVEDCDPQVSMMRAKNAVDNNAVFLLPLGGLALA